MNVSKRVIGLDCLKAVCAFLVVIIHFPFSGNLGSVSIAIARVAVPVFFMISGYFYFDKDGKGVYKKAILRSLKLIAYGTLLMLIVNLFRTLVFRESIIDYLKFEIQSRKIADVLLKNKAYVCNPLWYLYATVYVFFICLVSKKNKVLEGFLWGVTPILLFIAPIFGKYSQIILNKTYELENTRNFLFVGIPYYMLGALIKRILKKCKETNKYFLYYVTGNVVFSITTILEGVLLRKSGMQSAGDLYFSTFPLCVCLFLSAIHIKKEISVVAKIGRMYSTYIYIVHPAVATIILIFIKQCNQPLFFLVFEKMGGIIIYIITLLTAMLLNCIKNIYRKRNE